MNEYEFGKDILFDIEMQLYDEFNDKIATMNDHLGEIYSYKDVEDVKQTEQHRKIELMEKAIKELQQENEKLNHYKLLYQKVKDRNDKAIEVIDTQMKLAEDGVKENLRIIKFYLIKGECSMYDLTTEEDYKYKGNNE